MSSNYPYQRSLPDSDLRPDPRRSSSAPDANLYRQPHETFSAPSYSMSSSRGSAAPHLLQSSQDGVLSILSSCGLEPEDLSVLANLPEDVLTVDSLPHILKQIKGKRGSGEPFPPTASSCSFPSTPWSLASFSHRERDEQHSKLVQYPLSQISSSTSKSDFSSNRWESASTFSSVWSPLSSSSSFRHKTDYDYRPGHSGYGKTALTPTAGPAAQVFPNRCSGLGPTGHRAIPPSDERRSKAWEARSSSRFLSGSSSGRSSRFCSSLPSNKEAQDFHGMAPEVYPYSCSLCDITVLSEKSWTQHTNCTQHADGQLKLLQRFPYWDCRLKNISSDDSKSERWKDERKPPQTVKEPEEKNLNESQAPQSDKALKKPASDKGKVVCVKFPAQSVDEAYLRKLTEPFGKILKILTFPSLAFVELGSIDQAKDLVKFHTNYPPTVNGKQIEFSISSTFSFLQSSQVVSFTPAPEGKDGYSDLISIVKRFGAPLYTLVLPSKVFVEMKSSADALKLVNYYSSSKLKINDDIIKVAFSNEYKSLLKVSLAKKYEEEELMKDTDLKPRSGDRDRRQTGTSSRSRSRGRSRDSKSSRTRSRSRQRSVGSKRSRSRSRDNKMSRRHCRTRSKESSERRERSRTRSKSIEQSSNSSRQNQSKKNSQEPEPLLREELQTITGNIKQEPAAAGEEQEDSMSTDENDKGMEVIAEDGKMVSDEESLEEDTEEGAEENRTSEETSASSERVEEEKKMGIKDERVASVKTEEVDVKDAGAEQEKLKEMSEIKEEKVEETVFEEMSGPSEALKVAEELNSNCININGCRLFGFVSHENRLTNGWDVKGEEDAERRSDQRYGGTERLKPGNSEPEETHEKYASEEVVQEEESPLDKTEENESDRNPPGRKREYRKTPAKKTVKREERPQNEEGSPKSQRTHEDQITASNAPKVPEDLQQQRETEKRNHSYEPEVTALERAYHPEKAEQNALAAPPFAPVGGATEAERLAKAIGTEFVRPVVGYYCNLCQLIFCDEDEAKGDHCRTSAHYAKYQEKMGKDPGTS